MNRDRKIRSDYFCKSPAQNEQFSVNYIIIDFGNEVTKFLFHIIASIKA